MSAGERLPRILLHDIIPTYLAEAPLRQPVEQSLRTARGLRVSPPEDIFVCVRSPDQLGKSQLMAAPMRSRKSDDDEH